MILKTLFLKKFTYFNWRISALQYCFVLCHLSIWISLRNTYVLSLLALLPISCPIPHLWVITEHLIWVPLSYRNFSVAIYFTYGNVYVSSSWVNLSHSDWCEVRPHCHFDLYFSNNEGCWAFFKCVYQPFVCLLWRNVCLGLLPIFWLGYLFSWCWALWAAYIFWRLVLHQLFCLQLFSPILRVIF